jgi:hypothetical protein
MHACRDTGAANQTRPQAHTLLLLRMCTQVQTLTLGQLAAGSRGGGTALLYSRELQQQGLTAVSSRGGFILESWFNGTNTEVRGPWVVLTRKVQTEGVQGLATVCQATGAGFRAQKHDCAPSAVK